MIHPRYLPLVLKQVTRHRTRSLLTLGGVAIAMFLFCAVQGMQRGVADATRATGEETTLVVYRENRYCPFSSRLPDHYLDRIERIGGVRSAVPVKIVVNNCRTSLDVVTFRGVPPDRLAAHATHFRFISGSMEEWRRRSDAAILGETLALRRGLKVGDRFEASGVTVTVAGVVRSDEPQDLNAAYVHLDFLQRAAGARHVGIVTQFTVKVTDPARLDQVAAAIDAEFRHDPEPTRTRSEKEFVARAASDIVEIAAFTRWLGWGALAAVLGLVGNAIVLGVQDRVKEHAVLQTLGYRGGLIARLIIAEGTILAFAGGAIGAAAAALVIGVGNFSLSVEGLSMNVRGGWDIVAAGLAVSALLGVAAGLVPAWQASRREIASCFRSV